MNERKSRRARGRGEAKKSRKMRPRPTPRWLAQSQGQDEMARRRCLLILNVLSGAQPVTEAIAEAQMSRGTYYQLETKALQAMLTALAPGAESAPGGEGPQARIAQLEEKVHKLERDKRRAERLLFLTRQVLRPGPTVSGVGRPRKQAQRPPSRTPGKRSSPGSRSTPKAVKLTPPPDASTPTTAGGDGPSGGSAS